MLRRLSAQASGLDLLDAGLIAAEAHVQLKDREPAERLLELVEAAESNDAVVPALREAILSR